MIRRLCLVLVCLGRSAVLSAQTVPIACLAPPCATTVEWDYADPQAFAIASFHVQIDNADVATVVNLIPPFMATPVLMPIGSHTVTVTAVDGAGIRSAPSAGVAVQVTVQGTNPGPPPPPTNVVILPQPVMPALVLHLSEDAYMGDAQFSLKIDGVQIATETVTASHADGHEQAFTYTGGFTAKGTHQISVSFINDAWGGTPQTDRNLYLLSLSMNGIDQGVSYDFKGEETRTFPVTVP